MARPLTAKMALHLVEIISQSSNSAVPATILRDIWRRNKCTRKLNDTARGSPTVKLMTQCDHMQWKF
uniref:Uncharacterized protein n=1 Tax=Arion vulgaris TaxID=1028688 RepID=A0A0B6ZJ53_9EUPU